MTTLERHDWLRVLVTGAGGIDALVALTGGDWL